MKKTTVAIVDDAAFMRSMIKKIIMRDKKYEITGEGENGYDAIELAEKLKPDLMTLDITMPELDGINAIDRILNVSPNTKILMVSAMGQQCLVDDALNMGAKDFIIKPFSEAQFMVVIGKILSD